MTRTQIRRRYEPNGWYPVLDTTSPEDPLLLETKTRLERRGVQTQVTGRRHVTLWRRGYYRKV